MAFQKLVAFYYFVSTNGVAYVIGSRVKWLPN